MPPGIRGCLARPIWRGQISTDRAKAPPERFPNLLRGIRGSRRSHNWRRASPNASLLAALRARPSSPPTRLYHAAYNRHTLCLSCRPLRVQCCHGAAERGRRGVPPWPRSQAADRRRVHQEDPRVHDGEVLPVAARRLHARQGRRADAQGRPRRHRRRAGQASVLQGSVRLHAAAREGDAWPREGLLDRHDGRGPRAHRRRHRVRSADVQARREQGEPREARRSAHDRHERHGRQRRSPTPRRRSTTSPARSTRPKRARPRR